MAKINLGRVVGKDNYELAVQQGYVGTLDEWLESLKGDDGANGIDGKDGENGAPGTTDYNELNNKPDLSVYQTKTDESLDTGSKQIVDAINEVNAKLPIDPTNGSETKYLNEKGQFSEIAIGGGVQEKSFEIEITRPANTTVYTAGDVVADVSAVFKPFLNVAKAIGTGVKIIRVRIQTEDTGVAGTKFNLHLYKDVPSTFIADNAAFSINYANAAKRIGVSPIVMGTGNLSTVGANDYNVMVTNPVGRDITWILETVSGFTPSSNSTRFTIVIDCELSNN